MEDRAKISLKVIPGAAKSEILGFREGRLWVKVTASPEKGKANHELLSLLGEKLGISRSRLQIVKGETSRLKLVAVSGLGTSEVKMKLSSFGGADTSKHHRR